MAPRTRQLSDLGLTARSGGDVAVSDLVLDSRKIGPGALFAALPGTRQHGADFIATALQMGAGAILTDRDGAALAAQALAR